MDYIPPMINIKDMNLIAARIREEISKQEMTVAGLADNSGVQKSTIHKFLDRKTQKMNIISLEAVVATLGFLTIDDLISDNKNEKITQLIDAFNKLPEARQEEEIKKMEISAATYLDVK